MKTKNVTELLKTLIDIPSVAEAEAGVADFLAKYLEKQGFEVARMPVGTEQAGRQNVFAKVGNPRVLLQAHMDVVPPQIGASEDDEYIYGRGACDTKGPLASMVVAAQQARSQGITDFGLLFTVGEEVDFAGAREAQPFLEKLGAFVVIGEPTKLVPVTAHYGLLVFSVICTGKAAHSSEPQQGENAIEKLLSLLNGPLKKLKVKPGTLMTLAKISGGVADNIIPDKAEALFSFRIAPGDDTAYAERARELVGGQGKVEVSQGLPAVSSPLPASLRFLGEGQQAKYCTELTFFKKGVVFGPGSVDDAHGTGEKIRKSDLQSAVKIYERVLREYQAS